MAVTFERLYQAYGRFVLALGLMAGAAVFGIMWLIDANVLLLIGAGLTAWYAWAAYTYAVRSYNIDEMEWGVLIFKVWPIKGAIAVGWGLFSVQFLLDAIRHMFVAAGHLEPIPGDEV